MHGIEINGRGSSDSTETDTGANAVLLCLKNLVLQRFPEGAQAGYLTTGFPVPVKR